jgi:hypothetical protein
MNEWTNARVSGTKRQCGHREQEKNLLPIPRIEPLLLSQLIHRPVDIPTDIPPPHPGTRALHEAQGAPADRHP